MSDHDSHQTAIKTPKQLITVIVLAFIIPIVVILLLVNYVYLGGKSDQTEDAKTIEKRIQPVAHLQYIDPNKTVVYKTGEEVYQAVCISCHGTGAAGAPKFGDVGAWSARLTQGYDGLLNSLLHGKGAMQARAGTSADDYSDHELGLAVVYMVNQSGGSLAQPTPPAPEKLAASATQTQEAPAMQTTTPASSAAASTPAANVSVAVASADPEIGKKVYEQVCVACHAAGVGGAPKFGDKDAWKLRLSAGIDALHKSALNGKGIMPAKGGHTGSDDEVKAAVDYMIQAAK